MKSKPLQLLVLTVCFLILPSSRADAQESIELPDIRGSHSQIFRELKIEITNIRRLKTYQAYWDKSDRIRGEKIIAKPGFEIALIRIHTTRLGDNRGIKINHLFLFDDKANKYEGELLAIHFLGARSDSETDAKEHDYEFPVVVPEKTQISNVKIQHFTVSETKPYFVFQNLFFDVGRFNW